MAYFRGDLLEIANLLTTLQSHLIPEGFEKFVVISNKELEDDDNGDENDANDDDIGPYLITSQDLQNVLDYRRLLEEAEEIHSRLAMAKGLGRSENHFRSAGVYFIEQLTTELDTIQRQLKSVHTIRTRKFDILWTRFEVWLTQVVAERILLSSSNEFTDEEETTNVVNYSSSPLLNLPGSLHFDKLIPDYDSSRSSIVERHGTYRQNGAPHEDRPGLLPNKHTWNEFARISRMVMLLDRIALSDGHRSKKDHPKKLAIQSPCCLHDGIANSYKHHQQTLNKDFEFTPPNLMALWVRAQRNTQAMRHLWMLFKVFPKTAQDSNSHPLEFAGNPAKARDRVVVCSKLVDQFVEWVVTNQVLFTHRHIQKILLTAPMRTLKRKQDAVANNEKESLKRIRLDFSSASDRHDFRAAALVFIIRWFVRRNRFVASFLSLGDVSLQHLDFAWTTRDRKSVADIFEAVVQNYRKTLLDMVENNKKIFGEDRTIRRVEARILCGYDVGGGYNTFRDSVVSQTRLQILSMLDALHTSSEWNAAQDKQIREAKDDLPILFDQFFGSSTNIYELVDSRSELSSRELTEVFLSVPRPFPDSCYVCDDTKDKGPLCACANCERPFHVEQCSNRHINVPLTSLARLYDPFQKLCLLKQPQVERSPDYTIGTPLVWESLTVDIERGLRRDGSVAPLGLRVIGSKECADKFRRLSSHDATMLDLAKLCEREKVFVPPVLGVKDGYIVFSTKTGDYCGQAAGLLPGDVITAVEHLEISDPARAKYKKFHAFSEISDPAERLKILVLPSTKLRIVVHRPHRNIIEDSQRWYDSLVNLNQGFLSFTEIQTEYHICDECQVRSSSPDDAPSDRSAATVLEEARRCRAVIRRVGQESFASPFIDEDPFRSGQTSELDHGLFFSLRRLDAMMTSIVARHSLSENDYDQEASTSAFVVPPWTAVQAPQHRIEWASQQLEEEPINLLCQAIAAWQRVDERKVPRRVAKRKLIRMFLMLIPSWCILPSSTTASFRTTGPPKLYLNLREPWLTASCVFCWARPREVQCSCSHISCREMLKRDTENIGELKERDAPSALTKILSYNDCSSLVGSTVLFDPNDPLVAALKTEVVPFDHENRPVEYIVASYIPTDLVAASLKVKPKHPVFDRFDEGSGFFHLFPLVSRKQIEFVLDRCKIKTKGLGDENANSWVSPEVLTLDGVARYSLEELEKKITESDGIRSAMNAFVVSEMGVDNEEVSRLCPFPSRSRKIQQELFRVRSDQFLFDEALHLQLIPTSALPTLAGERHINEGREQEILGNQQRRDSDDVPKNPASGSLYILRPNKSSCTLMYSDIHYSSETEVPALIEALVPRNLSRTPLSTGSHIQMTVLLKRSNFHTSPRRYRGIGFGFEVVHWGGHGVLQVGRVHKESPAFGTLETGDIILSAGGKSIDDIRSIPELVTTLLGAPIHLRPNSPEGDKLLMTLSVVRESRTSLDSVVLTIQRQVVVPPSPVGQTSLEDGVEVASIHRTQVQVHNENPDSVAVSRIDSPSDQVHTNLDPSPRSEASVSQDPFLSDEEVEFVATLPSCGSQVHHDNINANAVRQIDNRIYQAVPNAENLTVAPINLPPGGSQVHHDNVNSVAVRQIDGRMYQAVPNVENLTLVPMYPVVEQFMFSSDLRLLRELVGQTTESRAPASIRHLYRAAGFESILTLLECAVFLEALLNEVGSVVCHGVLSSSSSPNISFREKQPKLGVRMLCPRYSPKVIDQEIGKISTWRENEILSIPRLSRFGYDTMIHEDFKRSGRETGTLYFFEHPYRYRKPNTILPIDRLAEDAIKHEGKVQQSSVWSQPNENLTNTEYDEFAPERIRGGGPLLPLDAATPSQVFHSSPQRLCEVSDDSSNNANHQDSNVCITNLSVQEWQNQPVYSLVDDDEGREILVVGFIHAATLSTDDVVPETVEVEVHYVQRVGYIAPSRVYHLFPEDTFLIDAAAPEEAVAVMDKLQGNLKARSSTQSTDNATEECSRGTTQPFELDITVGLSALGTVPDGRDIMWTAADPTALYITVAKEPRNLANGCSNVHLYGTNASTIRFGGEQFVRIAEGQEVLKVCSDLGTAIAAHVPYLSPPNSPDCEMPPSQLPSRVEFDNCPTGNKVPLAWSDLCLREKLIFEANASKNSSFSKVVSLWTAIGHRFEIESTGRFRLSRQQLEAKLQERYHKLSSLPGVTYESIDSSKETIESTGARLGCMLQSEVLFKKMADRDEFKHAGEAGAAKEILLHIATLMENSSLPRKRGDPADPLRKRRLWNDDNYAAWVTFVSNSTTPMMLSQAAVVLIGSIDTTNMPKWWKQDGAGWSTSQLMMASPNMDVFFLHMYVLDAALSEMISSSRLVEKSGDLSKEPSRTKESTQEKMARWLALADELPSFVPFNGTHNDDCLYCNDGGDLLCCEFCPHVAHPECCEPPIEKSEITSDLKWICEPCIAEIRRQKGITMD